MSLLAALTALNRHFPPAFPPISVRTVFEIERENAHMTCPQGVRVAFSGGEKQTGQVKVERAVGSSSSCASPLSLPFDSKAEAGPFIVLSNSRMRDLVGGSDEWEGLL